MQRGSSERLPSPHPTHMKQVVALGCYMGHYTFRCGPAKVLGACLPTETVPREPITP